MSDYIPKPGDRVRVAIEGKVEGVYAPGGPFRIGAWPKHNVIDPSAAHVVSVERLPDPEPEWKPGDVVLDADGDAYVRSATGGWWFEGDCYSDGVPRRPLTRLVPESKDDLRRMPTDVEVNRLAQRFYETAGISMPMTAKPQVVNGLKAVFAALDTPEGENTDE